jgi:hypothetical protein
MCSPQRTKRRKEIWTDQVTSSWGRTGVTPQGQAYLPRITPTPRSTSCRFRCGSLPTRSVSRPLSTLMIWDALATDSFRKPVTRFGSRTFPGAGAHLRFVVSGTQTTVRMALRFSASDWPSVARSRTRGHGQIRPPNFALRDHHSVFSRMRLAAADTNGSGAASSPRSSQTLFIASVISSGEWRIKYSLRASLNRRLRDRLVRRARRSALLKISSGMDTAVFIP